MTPSSTVPTQNTPTTLGTAPTPVQYPILSSTREWVGELWLDDDGICLDANSTNGALSSATSRVLAAEIILRCDQMDARTTT